jgi:hypothetical protein
VTPADGRYLVVVRSAIGGVDHDPRRCYCLSIRREEPAFDVVLLPGESEAQAGFNVPRGGRALGEVIAFRRRGFQGSIPVSATDLPAGIDCPEIWLGPGVDRAPVVLSARPESTSLAATLALTARSSDAGLTSSVAVRGGMMVGGDSPRGAGRITPEIAMGLGDVAPVRLTASSDHETYPQGSIVNIAVDVARTQGIAPAPVNLVGVLLPDSIENQTAVIGANARRGYISFGLPREVSPGHYSLVVRGETLAANPGAAPSEKPVTQVVYTNPVSFEVYPAPFLVEVDLHAPRKLKRGEIMQLNYTARRRNGFIGKIHTDLAAPGGVVGIRGRGVTFVGQVDSGVIQVIASDDAPLGPMRFLQLEGIGTVEDQPIYHANCFVDLEIIP